MTSPQATPLLLPSDYLAALAKEAQGAAHYNRLLDALIEASNLLQEMADRRFDEYIMEREYIPRSVADDGDLLDSKTLMLRADLKTLISVTNGDGTALSLNNLEPHPLNSPTKTRLVLDPNVASWTRLSSMSRLKVKGVWGYGGKWYKAGFTITLAAADTLTFTTSATVEEGMVLKADDEYLYVEDVSGSAPTFTVTMERGYNGSGAVAHTSATAYRWRPLPIIETNMHRMVAWRGEQKKAPLVGQVVIGDFTIPISVDGIPKDVLTTMSQANLFRKGDIA